MIYLKRNLVSRISFFLTLAFLRHRYLPETTGHYGKNAARVVDHVCSVRSKKGHRVAWGRDRAFAAIKNILDSIAIKKENDHTPY